MAATDPGAGPGAGAPHSGPDGDAGRWEHPDDEHPEDEPEAGGDPVCWLAQVCVECGALREGAGACWRCGAA